MVQVEVTANMVQEGRWAIVDAVMEKKLKARGPGCPQGLGRAIRSLADTCNVDNWMRGLDWEHLMGRQEGLVMLALNAPMDMVNNASNREYQGFLEVLPETHPL